MDARTAEQIPHQHSGHEEGPDGGLSAWRRSPFLIAGIALLVLAMVIAGLIWWLNARHYESTDDAFIDARTVSISSQVNGAIVDVPVTDNQLVSAGTPLVHIDDRDYRASLDQAIAQVHQAQANISNIDAQIDAQRARIDQAQEQVSQAQSALTFAKQQNDRYVTLYKSGSGTQEQAQQYASNLRQQQASLDAAQANLIAAQKQIGVFNTQRGVAQAQLAQMQAAQDQAQVNLDRTIIKAPVEGRVTRLTAAKGGYAQVGQALLMFVPTEIWVTANFKETQLTNMRPGQPVDIEIDAFPDHRFHGHVDSVQAGSGTAFSLLPAENATGNYVKIVQRVPVKITFDSPPDVELVPACRSSRRSRSDERRRHA